MGVRATPYEGSLHHLCCFWGKVVATASRTLCCDGVNIGALGNCEVVVARDEVHVNGWSFFGKAWIRSLLDYFFGWDRVRDRRLCFLGRFGRLLGGHLGRRCVQGILSRRSQASVSDRVVAFFNAMLVGGCTGFRGNSGGVVLGCFFLLKGEDRAVVF